MRIYKILPDGRKITRTVTEMEWREVWADENWVPERSFPIPAKTVSRFIEHVNGLNILEHLPQETFQNLLQQVDIQNPSGNTVTNLPLYDFILNWRPRGWKVKRMTPKSKALMSRKLILQRIRNSDSFQIARTPAQVRHAFEWDRSPIPEWIYKAQRPVRYAQEYAQLQRNHRTLINREWFIWAARQYNIFRIKRAALGLSFGTGNPQKEIWSLVLLNGPRNREPPRIIKTKFSYKEEE